VIFSTGGEEGSKEIPAFPNLNWEDRTRPEWKVAQQVSGWKEFEGAL